MTPVGLAEEVSVVVAFGFMASLFLMFSQCFVSSVQTGLQFTSCLKQPARTVFSVTSQYSDAPAQIHKKNHRIKKHY